MIYGDTLDHHPNLNIVNGDIRNISLLNSSLKNQDIVLHLACISNDPSFELNPQLGKSINFDCFEPFLKKCISNKIQKFIYASSSSVYGAAWSTAAAAMACSASSSLAMTKHGAAGGSKVGPEPMTAGSSPATSETASVITRAGAMRRANLPPLIAESRVRKRLSSSIGAPASMSSRVAARFASRVIPATGSAQSAEAPPDSSTRNRSAAKGRPMKSSSSRAACSLRAPGYG